jgi:hypothetical protein
MLLTFIANLNYAAGIVIPLPPTPSSLVGGKGKGAGYDLFHNRNQTQLPERDKAKELLAMDDEDLLIIVKFTLKNFIL